jgi:uncharacterized protein (DUF58 family)
MARGLTAAVLGAALIVAGAGFDSPSLLVPGVALAALATVALVWVGLATHGLRVERAPGPARIIEDEPYPLRITARGGRVGPPGGEIRDSVLDRPVGIGPRWTGTLALDVPLAGRGLRSLGPARLVVRDPLGLCTREIATEAVGELLVLPRVEPITVAGRGAGGRAALQGIDLGAGSGRLDARTIELEVDGLRAYREGSPASRIHWPAVARTGELVERRMVDGADSAPVVALDPSDPIDDESLDAAVRAAASLCFALASAGGCGALMPGERRAVEIEPDLRGWPTVHARLALVARGDAPPIPGGVAAALFWVTATAHPRPPRGAAARSGPLYLVAPAASLGGSAAAFSVAGCDGVLIAGPARRRKLARRLVA